MENIYLKIPTIEDKEKWIEYLKEYRLDNPSAKPLSCTEDLNYEEWLEKIDKESKGKDLEEGRVPSTVYFLMDEERIVGNLSIRHNIDNDFLSKYGGHIGYGVRPSERRKGYATKMLYLALEKCDELGLTDVMVSCKKDNIGSAKTIENNCGILKEEIFISEEKTIFKKYWINVKEALKKREGDYMIRYYCSGFDVNNIFGHGLGDMIKKELLKTDNLLFIPCGQKGYDKNENRDKGENKKEKYSDSFIRQLKNEGIIFKNNYVLNPSTDKEIADSLIQNSDFIIMMGGDPILMDEMLDELNIKEDLKKYNGILMGFSAGAMNMSKYIIITPCSDEYPEFVIKEGLNLDDISIYPHNNIKEEEFPEYVVNGDETTVTADLIKVAKEYGEFYLLQDYMNEDMTFDISIIKSIDGELNYYTENDGKIWKVNNDTIELLNQLNEKVK